VPLAQGLGKPILCFSFSAFVDLAEVALGWWVVGLVAVDYGFDSGHSQAQAGVVA
jgi:hypothetical protein